MYRLINIIGCCVIILILNSCGMTRGNLGNENSTVVNLSKNNFKIIKTAEGEATAHTVLGIFGFNHKDLYNQAKKNLIVNADLNGQSKALINFTVDESTHIGFLGLFNRKTITISAQVIEFIGE